MVSLTYFMPLVSFYNPRYIRKPEVWCFQGVCEETSGMKWIKVNIYVFGFFYIACKQYREEHPPEAGPEL